MLDTPHQGSIYSEAVQWQVTTLACALVKRAGVPGQLHMSLAYLVHPDVQQANGSILLATDAAGADALEARAAALHAQGIAAEVLTAQQTMHAEPAVMLPAAGGGLLVPSDAQLVRWPLACQTTRGCILASVQNGNQAAVWRPGTGWQSDNRSAAARMHGSRVAVQPSVSRGL